MGFFNIFKKKKEQTEIEKINWENIEIWLNKKQEEFSKTEKSFLEITYKKISELATEIEFACERLEKAQFSDKKAPQIAQLIVKENAKYYSIKAKKLSENLRDLKENKAYVYLEKLNKILSDFEKHSATNYQKASILIGDELAEIPLLINKTIEEINNLKNEKKRVLDFLEILLSIEQKINERQNLISIKKNIEKELENYATKLKILKEKEKNILKEMELKQSSKEYQNFLKKEKEHEQKKQDLKYEIYSLKELLNFKELAKIYHKNEKKMNILKTYRNNFYDSFENDSGETLLELLSEENPKHLEIKHKIKNIIEKRKNIEETKPKENPLLQLELEIKKISENIKLIESQHIEEIKKIEKIKEKEKSIKKEISSVLEKEGILISD